MKSRCTRCGDEFETTSFTAFVDDRICSSKCLDNYYKEYKKIDFILEGIYETNIQGYITEFPQFGKFGANKKIELFSKEVK